MLIDANAYVGEWPFRRLDGSAEAVVKRMDKHGIDRAVVSALQAPLYKNPQEANRELVDDIADFKNRFIPFATLAPTYPAWDADLEECIEELDMAGVRIFPAYHDYLLSEKPVIKLARVCADCDVPLMVCAVLQDQWQRHPRVTLREVGRRSYTETQVDALLELLRESPATDVIVADAGHHAGKIVRQSQPRREDIWLYNVERDGDLSFTLDGLSMHYVVQGADVIEDISAERIVFGSKLPLDYVSETGNLKLEHLPVEEDERAAIQSENLLSLLD